MNLAELRQVRLEIDHRCTRENWSNTWDGETLAPETVSLYDFAHYAILPQTVPAGVLLDGLSDQQLQQWNAGTVISQCGSDEKVTARGAVLRTEQNKLQVRVLEGEFLGPHDKTWLKPDKMRVQRCHCKLPQCECSDDTASAQLVSVEKILTLSWMELLSGVGSKGRRPWYFVSHWCVPCAIIK